MQHKTWFKRFSMGFICLFLSACVATENSTRNLSKRQEAETYLQMGIRYLDLNMIKIAKDKLDMSLALDKHNADTHNALGVTYERLQQYDLARQYYQQAVTINPDNASIKNNYGRFLCARGQYQEGILFLTQALAIPLNTKKWFAYTNMGQCALREGKKQLAETYFRQALQYNSQYGHALLEMQKISFNKRNFLSARAFLQRFSAVSKHTPQTLWYAVQTEQFLGNSVLAKQYREQLLTLFPTSKEAQQLANAVN